MHKKKIVLVQSMAYTLGGMTSATVYIGDMLCRMGHQVEIVTKDQSTSTNTLRHYTSDDLSKYYSISEGLVIKELKFDAAYGAMKDNFSDVFIKELESADMVISFNEGLASLPSVMNLKNFWVYYHFPSINAPPDLKTHIMCNSYYTATHVLDFYDTYPTVVHPLPHWGQYRAKEDKDIDILWVGRFSTDKNIELLNKLICDVEYSIVAVGSDWWEQFSPKRLDEKIQIVKNAKIEQLREYYSRSKIILSTKGYGERDPEPSKREHFGITIIEGAYSGSIPLVHRSGGPYLDFLNGQEGVFGYSYTNLPSLKMAAKKILDADKHILSGLRAEGLTKAQDMYNQAYTVLEGVVNG